MKQAEEKITALYERLSRDDDNAGAYEVESSHAILTAVLK